MPNPCQYLGRCFGQMYDQIWVKVLPSFVKSLTNVNNVSMNNDDTTLWEHPKNCSLFICFIHDYICNRCQHSSNSIKIGRIVVTNLSMHKS